VSLQRSIEFIDHFLNFTAQCILFTIFGIYNYKAENRMFRYLINNKIEKRQVLVNRGNPESRGSIPLKAPMMWLVGLPGFGFILVENIPTDEKFVGIAAIVLTGRGHARKMGISARLQKSGTVARGRRGHVGNFGDFRIRNGRRGSGRLAVCDVLSLFGDQVPASAPAAKMRAYCRAPLPHHKVPEPGALHLTRCQDFLELTAQRPDMSIYDRALVQRKEVVDENGIGWSTRRPATGLPEAVLYAWQLWIARTKGKYHRSTVFNRKGNTWKKNTSPKRNRWAIWACVYVYREAIFTSISINPFLAKAYF
jgi:hypothetical protein